MKLQIVTAALTPLSQLLNNQDSGYAKVYGNDLITMSDGQLNRYQLFHPSPVLDKYGLVPDDFNPEPSFNLTSSFKLSHMIQFELCTIYKNVTLLVTMGEDKVVFYAMSLTKLEPLHQLEGKFHHMAIDDMMEYLYVISSGSENLLARIDLVHVYNTRQMLYETLTLPQVPSHFKLRKSLIELDSDLVDLATFKLNGTSSGCQTLDADDQFAYQVCQVKLKIVNETSGASITMQEKSIQVSVIQKFAFVLSESGQLSLINSTDGQSLKTISVSNKVNQLQYHSTKKWLIMNINDEPQVLDVKQWLGKYHDFFYQLSFIIPQFKDGALRNKKNITVVVTEEWYQLQPTHLLVNSESALTNQVKYTVVGGNMNGCGSLRLKNGEYFDKNCSFGQQDVNNGLVYIHTVKNCALDLYKVQFNVTDLRGHSLDVWLFWIRAAQYVKTPAIEEWTTSVIEPTPAIEVPATLAATTYAAKFNASDWKDRQRVENIVVIDSRSIDVLVGTLLVLVISSTTVALIIAQQALVQRVGKSKRVIS